MDKESSNPHASSLKFTQRSPKRDQVHRIAPPQCMVCIAAHPNEGLPTVIFLDIVFWMFLVMKLLGK